MALSDQGTNLAMQAGIRRSDVKFRTHDRQPISVNLPTGAVQTLASDARRQNLFLFIIGTHQVLRLPITALWPARDHF